jgi:electron transfer flavoprotein alpha subunit
MPAFKDIWVLPEMTGQAEEISKLSLGLLTEARLIAARTGGSLTALIFGDEGRDYCDVLQKYGVDHAIIFKDPFLKYPDGWLYSKVIENLGQEKPFIFLMGHTVLGREMAPRLAVKWGSGVVSNCCKIDFGNPLKPRFYRAVWAEQAYQEIIFQNEGPRIVMLDPRVLNISPGRSGKTPEIETIEPKFKSDSPVKHLGCLRADFQTLDITEARVVVGAGAGSLPDDIFPLVKELAALVEGAVGGTRPVIDDEKLERDRLIGQTGKLISPELYLALGVSGASHHVGGIQEAKTIVSVNCDPQAPIFQASDAGLVADLREVLPALIQKIKQARQDGKII